MTEGTGRILPVGDDRAGAVAAAVAAIRGARLAVLPTDTVYAVCADAFNPVATRRVFGAKRRGRAHPLPVLVRTPKQLLGICSSVPVAADRLMAAYWPGPLTIVVPAQPELPWDLGDDGGAVAVRMPLDELVLEVVREVGPIAGTAANLAGRPPATTARAARDALGDAVEVYVDDGVRRGTAPSTIVDVTRDEPHVLREGPVPARDALAVARGDLDPLEAAARLLDPPADADPGSGDDDAGTDDVDA